MRMSYLFQYTGVSFVSDYGRFDFIIVGAGSTGCVIANRLSENPKWNILLLEAGTYRDEELTRIPAWGGLNRFSKFNWGFYSVPQKTAFLGEFLNLYFTLFLYENEICVLVKIHK